VRVAIELTYEVHLDSLTRSLTQMI
jgi:hypothetical protein